jgi:hypothetical protein
MDGGQWKTNNGRILTFFERPKKRKENMENRRTKWAISF